MAAKDTLEFAKLVAVEFRAVFRNVHPQTPLAAYRGGAFDGKANCDRIIRPSGEVYVFANDIGSTIILEGQDVHLIRGDGSRNHVERNDGRPADGGWI